MIQAKLKQCVECPDGKLSVLWSANPKLCRYHAQVKTAKKHIGEKVSVVDKDLEFYKYLWKKRDHVCIECGNPLKEFNMDMFHHILPKKKGHGGYPYFRHEEKNVILLCGKFGCHGKAESAISYPKMKIFGYCENVKKKLLESVGMEYNPKN